MNIIVTSLFGLESLVRADLEAIGYKAEQITVNDGIVILSVTDKSYAVDIARTNMWVRRGERVLLEVASFPAASFEEFFEGFEKTAWSDYIPGGYAFIVNGFSRKSRLFGISACQSLAKKAIVKSLLSSLGMSDGFIREDKAKGEIRIQFGIVEDVCRVMIDTSGDGLHKRGYRPLTHEAPIKETLAAGMVSLAHFKPFGIEALADPFCGSGTILIEAALMSCGAAPGRHRHFSFENLPYIGKRAYELALAEAADAEDFSPADDRFFWGSDIDAGAVANARINAEAAGVSDFINFDVCDAALRTPERLARITGFDRQLVLTNPPYGGRLLTEEKAEQLYCMIADTYLTEERFCKKGIRLSVISPDDTFETAVGRKADKRNKLYNGNIKCQLNNYYRMYAK